MRNNAAGKLSIGAGRETYEIWGLTYAIHICHKNVTMYVLEFNDLFSSVVVVHIPHPYFSLSKGYTREPQARKYYEFSNQKVPKKSTVY